jgi:hypothetical protein
LYCSNLHKNEGKLLLLGHERKADELAIPKLMSGLETSVKVAQIKK